MEIIQGTGQPTVFRAQSRVNTGIHEGLCIPCAVGTTDFKERAPHPTDPLGDGYEVRAWIGGLSFKLVYHQKEGFMCSQCGEAVPAMYICDHKLAA
jgi:hypothetical protein